MRVRVSLYFPEFTIASVNVTAGWLDRLLFGARELDFVACAVSIPDGGVRWLDDATGRRIRNPHIVAELDRERRRSAALQRLRSHAVHSEVSHD